MSMRHILDPKVVQLWAGIEEHLAGNFPRLWGLQIHVATGLALVGLAISLISVGLFAATASIEVGSGLLALVSLVEFGGLLIWFIRVMRIPRPRNIVEYRNSPSLAIVGALSIGFMVGPILLVYFVYRGIPKDLIEFGPLAIGELLFFAVMFRFSLIGAKPQLSKQVGLFAGAAFFSAIVGGFAFWLDLRTWPTIGVIVVFVGFGICRFLLSVRAGWRSQMDAFWLAVGICMLPVGAIALIRGSFSTFDRSVLDGNLMAAVPLFVGSALKSTAIWLNYMSLILVLLWFELATWVQSRFSMLPERE